VRRDKRFDKSDKWKQAIGAAICEAIRDYKDDDFISVPILENGTIAAARGNDAPAFLSNLILPSHLLRIARDFYLRRRLRDCIEFCRRAYDMKGRLPDDARVEVLRLWGLATIRLGRDYADQRDWVMEEIGHYKSRVARRVRLFLEGFRYRLAANLDLAEEKFLEALSYSSRNLSINRELASLYCKEKRYAEAESYARTAYNELPTNPYTIDVFAETLLGKQQFGLPVDSRELQCVISELRRYGDAPGSSFFLIRDAQAKARDHDYKGALAALERAIDRTPTLLPPYFIRAAILLQQGDVAGAERDRDKINQLLETAGGLSEGDEAQAAELEIGILIEKKQFHEAKEKTERSIFLSRKVIHRLLREIAKGVAFEPDFASESLKSWAAKVPLR
jgi:tetratricopeptide (TPR) repeat protein